MLHLPSVISACIYLTEYHCCTLTSNLITPTPKRKRKNQPIKKKKERMKCVHLCPSSPPPYCLSNQSNHRRKNSDFLLQQVVSSARSHVENGNDLQDNPNQNTCITSQPRESRVYSKLFDIHFGCNSDQHSVCVHSTILFHSYISRSYVLLDLYIKEQHISCRMQNIEITRTKETLILFDSLKSSSIGTHTRKANLTSQRLA